MSSVRERVSAALPASAPAQNQLEAIKKVWVDLINEAKSHEQLEHTCKELLDAVVNNDGVSLMVSRQLVGELINNIVATGSPLTQNSALAVGEHLLALVQPRILSYEDQAARMREHLAAIYEERKQFRHAAKMLADISMEGGQR